VRPLLNTKKEDILSYCAKNNIDFVMDSTNSDTNYSRNFIRADLTPKMYELQPNLERVFSRLKESANEANDFIECSAKEFIKNECEGGIPLSKFNHLHTALKSRVIMLSNNSSLEHTHIQSIIALCQKAEPHSSISLPNNVVAKIENGKLLFANHRLTPFSRVCQNFEKSHPQNRISPRSGDRCAGEIRYRSLYSTP
jgi:hypothetical protein